MAELLDTITAWLGAALAPTLATETAFGAPTRIHGLYLLSALMLAMVLYGVWATRSEKRGLKGFLAFAFPKSVYTHASAFVDVQIWLVNKLFTAGIALALAGLATSVALAVGGWLEGTSASGVPDLGLGGRLALFTVLLVLVSDFAVYWVHRVFHEAPVLWPFHRLHHTAEVMTPLTLYRKHPVYDLASFALRGLLVGTAQGVLLWAWPGPMDYWTLLGENVLYAAFNIAGSNLRHTHIWLGFGPFWSRIFMSPAQHQIHHSLAREHWDKNYGEVFALWDWAFGTLYVPQNREALTFGVADRTGEPMAQLHPNLLRAYAEPFEASWAAFRGQNEAPLPPSLPEPADPAPPRGAGP